jgi:hypothetical protein
MTHGTSQCRHRDWARGDSFSGTAGNVAIVGSELAIVEPQLSLVGFETRGEARHDLPGLDQITGFMRWDV